MLMNNRNIIIIILFLTIYFHLADVLIMDITDQCVPIKKCTNFDVVIVHRNAEGL